MTGHTRGPWSVQVASGALVIFGNSTMPRTVVSRVPNKGYPEVAYYDARLIAAAPELLEACELFAKYDSSDPHEFEDLMTLYAAAVEAARAAIAKATGAQL